MNGYEALAEDIQPKIKSNCEVIEGVKDKMEAITNDIITAEDRIDAKQAEAKLISELLDDDPCLNELIVLKSIADAIEIEMRDEHCAPQSPCVSYGVKERT